MAGDVARDVVASGRSMPDRPMVWSRRSLLLLVVAGSLVGIAGWLHRPRPRPRPRPSGFTVLVPAYFYPGESGRPYWEQLATTAREVPLRVVLNPASGPGTAADSNYVAALRTLRAAGARILGYVHTSYGSRGLDEVEADLEAYLQIYAVDGLFLDEMSTQPCAADYYARIRDRIRERAPGLELVGNPGAIVPESFLNRGLADMFVVFEGPARRFQVYSCPRWMRKYPRSRFGAIVHQAATAEEMERVVDVAAKNHLGSLFISDGTDANPYDRLPAYWFVSIRRIREALAGPDRDTRPRDDAR